MTRKVIALLVGLFGLALLGALAYFGWNLIRTGSIFGGPEEGPAAPAEPAGPFVTISAGPVLDYFPTQDGIVVLKENGEVSLAENGGEEVLSPASSDVPFAASISFDKQYLLVGFGTKDFPQFSIYDIGKKIWQPLRGGSAEGAEPVGAAVWAPQGLRVAYLKKAGEQWSLELLDFAAPKQPKGAATSTPADPLSNPSVKKLATLALLDAKLDWIVPEKLYLTSTPSAFDRGFLMEYDLQKNTVRSLLSDEAGLSLRWREDGGLGAKFSLRGQTPTFVGIDGSGKTLGSLPFITLPEKCAFSDTLLYCGVPTLLPQGTQLPDDYHQKAFPVRDAILKASLDQGTFVTLANAGAGALDATHLAVSGNDLLFVNEYDKKLYRMAR